MLTSGAPCPPAATSRGRKSATTGQPVRSAIHAGWPICRVPSSGAALDPVEDGLAVGGDQVRLARRRVLVRSLGQLGERLADPGVQPADLSSVVGGRRQRSRDGVVQIGGVPG